MAATSKDETQIALSKNLNHIPSGEEYEKMISGMLYNSLDPSLTAARHKARKFCHEYNTTWPSGPNDDPDTLAANRTQSLEKVIGRLGKNVYIEPPFYIDYGSNLSLGTDFYSNFNLTILDCGLVTIGNRVMIGPHVSIFAATHETEVQSRRDYIEYARPVEIGDDCWIGGHVVILPGVRIGKGCTIAASSVVTKSVPDWSVARGSPAKVCKTVEPLPPMEGDGDTQ